MYYRVAIRLDASHHWQWESRMIASLDVLFRVLRLYRTMPWDQMCVFFSSSIEGMDPMLARAKKGLVSNSIPAAHHWRCWSGHPGVDGRTNWGDGGGEDASRQSASEPGHRHHLAGAFGSLAGPSRLAPQRNWRVRTGATAFGCKAIPSSIESGMSAYAHDTPGRISQS